MNFTEYQELARRTQNPKLAPVERRDHALFGIPSEVGEVMGNYQKTYQGHALDKDKVVEELGDILWFVAELADVLNVGMDDIAERNIAKLRRRYPDGFSAERSINRED